MKIIGVVLTAALLMTGCGAGAAEGLGGKSAPSSTESVVTVNSRSRAEEVRPQVKKQIGLKIGEKEVPVAWEDNPSVRALEALCPLTIGMTMYGGNEQVGSIGRSLVRSDREITTVSGDIVLYSGSKLVIFYGSNTWAYTKLGRVQLSPEEMTRLLGGGDVTVTLFVK